MRADRSSQLFGLVVLAVLATPAASAFAFCRLTTTMAVAGAVCSETGAPLYWPRQCINYSIVPREADDIALDDIRNVVDESFATWTETQCGDHVLGMSLVQTNEPSMCGTPQYNERAANVNSIIFVSDWAKRKLPPEAFGLTLVWHRSKSGVIVDADMQLNEGLGPLTICGAQCPDDAVDLQNIITHEAGHFLGLGHSNHTNACMYGKALVSETSKRYLSDDDMNGICAVYGDREAPSCSSADYTPDHGQGEACSASSHDDSGCAVVTPLRAANSRMSLIGFALLASAIALRIRRRQRQA